MKYFVRKLDTMHVFDQVKARFDSTVTSSVLEVFLDIEDNVPTTKTRFLDDGPKVFPAMLNESSPAARGRRSKLTHEAS